MVERKQFLADNLSHSYRANIMFAATLMPIFMPNPSNFHHLTPKGKIRYIQSNNDHGKEKY